MLKQVFTSLCFALISGCALMETSDVEVEKQVTETSVSKPQLEPATGQLAVAAPLAETQSASAESKNFSPEYVKRIQPISNAPAFTRELWTELPAPALNQPFDTFNPAAWPSRILFQFQILWQSSKVQEWQPSPRANAALMKQYG
jgi:hypothetical protein